MSTAAQAKPVAVINGTPQNAAQVIQQTGKTFDQWLQSISDGHLSVDSLKTIGSAVPIVGNLISVGDVIVDLMEMSEKSKKKQEVDVFDWLFLGVLVGVVPAAGGLFKMGARPTLKLCASSVRRAGGDWLKMELSASLTQKVANMLPADFRNMPHQWVKHVDGKMQSTLETCGGKGKVIISPGQSADQPGLRQLQRLRQTARAASAGQIPPGENQ